MNFPQVQFKGIATVNKETFIDVLRRLRDAVRMKRTEKWRTELVSPSRQCSNTPVGFGQGFLSK